MWGIFRLLLYINAFSHTLSITLTQLSFFLTFPYIAIYGGIKSNVWRKTPLLGWFGLWIGWIVVGSLFIPDHSKILKQVLSWWHGLFFFFAYLAVRLGEDPKKLCLLAIVSSSLHALYGVFQFVTSDGVRAVGGFSNSLTYANSLALTAIGIISWLVFSYNLSRRKRVFLIFSLVVIFSGILVSLSRTAVYGLFLVGSLLVVSRHGWKGVLALAMFCILFFVTTFHNPRFERLYNRGYTVVISDSTRSVLWSSAIKIIRDYPVFGIGVHVFPKLVDTYAGGHSLDAKGHAHNAYLQGALNYGLPGLFLLLCGYALLGFRLIQGFRRTYDRWAVVGLAILIMYMLEGVTEDNFGDAEVTMYFWFLQGMVLGQLTLRENEQGFLK
ncbi:MAG: O-antigen ligase family protein [Syntrophobacterales bacterium]|nr:O-antigen ligase family protein [Syntrophobacterales bacterium]